MADGMLSLSWNNHKATFCHILATLRDKEKYTDVTVACEGRFYPVHKLVLSTCSEYFEKIFENTPCKHPVIVLKDVNRCDLEALFCYMYEGAVSVAQSNLGRLIKAAEVLRIKGLAVPDEPPISEGGIKRMGHSHHNSDDRSSPHPKRRRREDCYNTRGAAAHASPSPPHSPKTSPSRSASEIQQHSSSRSKSDGVWANQTHDDQISDQLDDRPGDRNSRSSPTPPQVEVTVDESLVKEEIVDQGDEGQDDVMDSGMDYGSVGSDSRLDGSAGGGEEDPSGHMMPNKYEQKVNPLQAQPLPEAVVEALAGPSGMQGWLGGCEMPSGFSGLEGYGGGEGNQDLSQVPPGSQPQAHQMVERESNCQWTGGGRTTQDWQDVTTASKVHHCPHCAYNTSYIHTLRRHILKHTGEKPFSCPHCSYSTTRNALLKEHIHTHTGERPFACPHCPYSSSHKNILKRHIRTHTGEKPYMCTLCSYQAASKTNLNTHLLTHVTKDRIM